MSMWMITEERRELAQCGSLLDSGQKDFLKQFRLFDVLSVSQKKELMLQLQKSLITRDTLNWYREYCHRPQNVDAATRALISKWNRSSGSITAPLMSTNMIVSIR